MIGEPAHPILMSTGIFRIPLSQAGCADFREASLTMFRHEPSIERALSGIDIGFRCPADVFSLALSDESVAFCRRFPSNTCHFPYEYEISDTPTTWELIRALSDLIHRLNIRHTVFHPQCIIDMDFLWNAWQGLDNGAIHLENWMRDDVVPRARFESLLINDHIGIVLDSSHAALSSYARSGYPFSYFLPRFEERIQFVHLSGIRTVPPYRDPEEPAIFRFCTSHHFMHTLERKDSAYFEPVWILLARKPSVGIIFEQTAGSLEEFPLAIEREIAYVRTRLRDSRHGG